MQEQMHDGVQKGSKMLHVEEIRRHLQYMVASRVSNDTGLERTSLIRLRDGITKNPSHNMVAVLSEFLEGLRNDG